MTSLTLIRVTCPSQRVAAEIADAAVDQRLAACANIEGPMTSTYRWKGVVEQAFEFVLWLKAPAANFAKIEALTNELHPYDVPAITGTACTHASADYEAWVKENTDV
ncbi:MAG: divalent-cation tolerance protein CutA [Henriciella sp.]|nr:divalent-cation tolerance protein CutA [Henriciella sp.]